MPIITQSTNPEVTNTTSGDNYLDMVLDPKNVPLREGIMSWNSTHKTLDIQPDILTSSLQVGQEEWIHCMNRTGVTIANGKAVYINDAASDHPTIVLADANLAATAYVIGITTDAIPDGEMGFVTCRGMLHGFDTSGYTTGSVVYLSAVTPGELSPLKPLPPAYIISVGVTLNSQVDGIIYVSISSPYSIMYSTDLSVAAKDPTGFLNNDAIDVSYDSSTQKITLTGDLSYMWRGAKLSLTSPWASTAHTNVTGAKYFLYSTDGITFAWSTTAWSFSDLMVSVVEYGVTNKFATREVHGIMPWQVHEEFHSQIGCYRLSGGTVSNYVLNSTTAADRRPDVSSTVVKDEDIRSTEAAHTSKLYTKAFINASNIIEFTVETADIVPLSGANPYYNSFSGTWGQTLMGNNTYMSLWLIAVPVASNATSQKYRYFWLQGQTNGSQATEVAHTPLDLDLADLQTLFAEFVFITHVVIRYTAANWTITNVINITGTAKVVASSPAGVYLSTVTTDGTLTGLGTVASPLKAKGLPTQDYETKGISSTGNHTFVNDTVERFIRSNCYGGAIRLRGDSTTPVDRGIYFGKVDGSLTWTEFVNISADTGNVLINLSTPVTGARLEVNGTVTGTSFNGMTALCTTNTDIQALGTQNAGSLSTAAKANHTHPSAYLGVANNSNAGIGYVGEYVIATVVAGSAVNVPNSTPTAITSITLSAGDWDITGTINWVITAATGCQYLASGTNTAVSLGTNETAVINESPATGAPIGPWVAVPTRRYALSGSTTIYLIAQAGFTGGTMTAYGSIRARRMR